MKKILVSAALIAVMFFQLNHLAVMNLTTSHNAASQCTGQQKQTPVKCLCCFIEQADKNQQIFNRQNFNLTPALPRKMEAPLPNFSLTNSQKYPKENHPKHNIWLRTIVQNK